MSTFTPAIKRHNHKIHPCPFEKKEALLKQLCETHSDKTILVITNVQTEVTLPENAKACHDSELSTDTFELVISYELPTTPEHYLARLALTSSQAIILLDVAEKQALYEIEKLLERTIIQENVRGFSPYTNVKSQRVLREEKAAKIASGELRDNRPDRIRESKFGDKKKSGENRKGSRYEGRDDNDKPKFSGKTGDRNHRHDGSPRERDDRKSRSYDNKGGAKKSYNKHDSASPKSKAPKRTPRKISINSIKTTEVTPKESSPEE